MTSVQEARAQQLIDKHIVMSGITLETLQKAGLTEDKQIPIEFFFAAPNERAAKNLIANLEENDCLNLSSEKSGGLFSRKWSVKGQTYPTKIDIQVLSQWLPWIIVKGISLDCEFDGWGAEI